MALTREEREALATKRILSVLAKHGVANARTLEQKISDAGPLPQRIDPHILTPVRRALLDVGAVVRVDKGSNTWFHLGNAPQDLVQKRLAEQLGLFQEFTKGDLTLRVGQTLEIAAYRAMLEVPDLEFFGRFADLNDHADDKLYSKEEPPQHLGARSLPGDLRLDFIVRHPSAGYLGMEIKNIREWIYPDRDEITDLIAKCLALNCVPVLVARRIPFVTFKVLNACGVVVHQTYNQLLPQAAASIAAKVAHKEGLGYHDIRLGNTPDKRLTKFIATNLPAVAPEARSNFEAHKDLLAPFSSGDMTYKEFAARVRRRAAGTKEDNDWPEEEKPEFQPVELTAENLPAWMKELLG